MPVSCDSRCGIVFGSKIFESFGWWWADRKGLLQVPTPKDSLAKWKRKNRQKEGRVMSSLLITLKTVEKVTFV